MSGVNTSKRQLTVPKRVITPAPGRSLAERFPDLASEWDHAGNGGVLPAEVTYGSDRVVSWVCPKGHGAYLLKVYPRTSRGKGCPKCGRLKVHEPKNGKTLAVAFPAIAAEWDYDKNFPLTPADVAPRSNKKAYFICPKGHGSTESYISNRTAGNGCLECGHQRSGAAHSARAMARGTLAERIPALAADWNTGLNTKGPSEVSHGSVDFVWWNCAQGHEPFRAQVATRARGHGCPVCANIRRAAAIRYQGPKPGTTLADKRPDLISEWDTERNSLSPTDVAVSSKQVVHWICPDGHRYERSVARRTAVKTCPVERAQRDAARKAV